jgi:hypothetical protein
VLGGVGVSASGSRFVVQDAGSFWADVVREFHYGLISGRLLAGGRFGVGLDQVVCGAAEDNACR